MINFDSLILKIFEQENKNFFIDARVQKIQQPGRNELIFNIRNKGENRKFYINFNPEFYHICFMTSINEQRRNITIPKNAPMFCMLLRKYILNSKIVNISVPKYERILEIYFEYFDELNEKSQLCLAIELMGKYSNVILYNYDTNVIIGCAHNVSSEKSRERELYGSLPYIYPTKQNKKNLLHISLEDFIKATQNCENLVQTIVKNYYYLTIPVVETLINEINDFSLKVLFDKLISFLSAENYSPCISNDYSMYFLQYLKNSYKFEDVNSMIDEYFSFHQMKQIQANLKSKILKNISIQLKKLYSLKEKQEIQVKKLEESLIYKNKADIIMSNLYNIGGNEKNIDLYDFEGNLIKIELDNNISSVENANKYYALYRKLKTGAEYSSNMLQNTNLQILYFEEQKFYVENSDDIILLKEVYDELYLQTVKKDDLFQKIEPIEYENHKIYIGKNQKQNDYILSKIAMPDDLWFHVLNAPGSHVLVKRNNLKEEIPDNILLKAAQLTKEFSSQKNNSKTSVIYTKRKYLKKANNKLAFVTYKNESEIII